MTDPVFSCDVRISRSAQRKPAPRQSAAFPSDGHNQKQENAGPPLNPRCEAF
jgi:hypothetical protein